MKYIVKQGEPAALLEYKNTPDVCYESLSSAPMVRNAVKLSLLEEQGYLCCYCGSKIKLDCNTILEHLFPREVYPCFDLEYNNLLASCDGGQLERGANKNKKFPSFCDDKKSNKEIPVSPLAENCESEFYYDEDGNIFGASKPAEDTIIKLNLRNPVLNARRKAAIRTYADSEFRCENWTEEIEYVMNKKTNGTYLPFCFVAKYYIEHFIIR